MFYKISQALFYKRCLCVEPLNAFRPYIDLSLYKEIYLHLNIKGIERIKKDAQDSNHFEHFEHYEHFEHFSPPYPLKKSRLASVSCNFV